MKAEIEIKFCPVDKETCRQKLQIIGFQLKQVEFLMTRVTMHSPLVNDRWGRIRQEHDKVTMTVKRVVDASRVDGTLETELVVPSLDQGIEFMEAVGFSRTSYQENYREVWVLGNVEVTLDTWPGLPPLIEIEGPTTEDVYNICEQLDFSINDALYSSIDIVYEKVLGISSQDIIKMPIITFDNPPKI